LRSTSVLLIGVLTALLCYSAPGQDADIKEKEAQLRDMKGLAARATPEDYQSHVKAGQFTLAGEFDGHAFPTADGVYDSEDFIAVEFALYGPPGARKQIVLSDFELRINGKKTLSPQPSELVLHSLKDPQWAPPPTEQKSKTSIGSGGNQDSAPPAPVHMPFELQRAMEIKVQKAALSEGDRALPVAGLLFFEYHGKEKGIRSIELTYAGTALPFQP